MENNQEPVVLEQLRKSIEKLGFPTEKYGDPTLMRFLIARSMDPEKASKMFVQWRKWRNSLVPSGFISDSEVLDELEAEKVYLQGFSKMDLPVLILKGCKHYPSKDQLQFKKYSSIYNESLLNCAEFVAHVLDKTIASSFKGGIEIGSEKLLAILDLKDISYKNVDPRGYINAFQFLQSYYPERLAKLYILHMPQFFVSVWKLISRFLDKATIENIIVVNKEDQWKEIIGEVGKEILPEEYGGVGEFIPIQDVVVDVTLLNH